MNQVIDQFTRMATAASTHSRLTLIDHPSQGEQTVEEPAPAAELTVADASRQLRLLAEARLVVARRDPPRVYYRLASEQVAAGEGLTAYGWRNFYAIPAPSVSLEPPAQRFRREKAGLERALLAPWA